MHTISLPSETACLLRATMHIIILLSSFIAQQINLLPSDQHLSAVLTCTSYCCLSTASFQSANMHIISLSQYGIFQQCYHAPYLPVISTASFHSATMHCILQSSIQHLSQVLQCTVSRCLRTASFHCAAPHCRPQYNICHQCNHALYLAVSVQHLSPVLQCAVSRCLSTASFH